MKSAPLEFPLSEVLEDLRSALFYALLLKDAGCSRNAGVPDFQAALAAPPPARAPVPRPL